MREPDPEVIRMIMEGLRYQNPDIPAPDVPRGNDSYPWAPVQFIPTDIGLEGHRRSDRLDDDEPAALRDTWSGMGVETAPWLA